MKRANTLDIQNLLGDLEKDVIEAMAAERSAQSYDEYLLGQDEDPEMVEAHEYRLQQMQKLLHLLKWYSNDNLIKFRRPPYHKSATNGDNAAEAGGE